MIRVKEKLPYLLFPLSYLPFSYVFSPFVPMGIDIMAKLIARIQYGDLSKYHILIDGRPSYFRSLRSFMPTFIDLGTIDHIKKGDIHVINGSIKQFLSSNHIEFENGILKHFDGVVLATGYSGIVSFLRDDICTQAGLGNGVVQQINSGKECSTFPQLWFLWGTIQMIREAAPNMLLSLQMKLGYPLPFFTSKRIFCAYHTVLTSFVVFGFYKFVVSKRT